MAAAALSHPIPEGGGGKPRDETVMFDFTFCPSFRRFLLGENIVEEIPFILVFMAVALLPSLRGIWEFPEGKRRP